MRPRKKDESEMNFPPEEWFAEQDTYFYPVSISVKYFYLKRFIL